MWNFNTLGVQEKPNKSCLAVSKGFFFHGVHLPVLPNSEDKNQDLDSHDVRTCLVADFQPSTGLLYVFLRGGNSNAFYFHPKN